MSTLQTLAVFAFGRLLAAVPITPGGVGFVELGYIGGLDRGRGNEAQVVAAVLMFRVPHLRDPDPDRRLHVT